MDNKLKKKEKYDKENLKSRLSAILTIYLDGLSMKKKKKMDKYLDAKLGDVVNYYKGMLKKKKSKPRVLPQLSSDLNASNPASTAEEENKPNENISVEKESGIQNGTDSGQFNQEAHLSSMLEKFSN